MLGQLGQPDYNSAKSKPSLSLLTDYSIGRISVGGVLGFHGAEVITNSGTVEGSAWSIIGRALFHLGNNDRDKLDIYGGAGLGVGVWTYESDFKRNPFDDFGKSSGAQFSLPFYLGGRYFFSEHLGATFELSTNFNQLLSIGVSYRL